MILVDGAVDDRYLALPECVVQGVVDLLRGEAKTRSGVAVDVEVGFQPALLLIGTHVRQNRTVFERVNEPGCPRVEVVYVVRLQSVLVLRAALLAAGADILHLRKMCGASWKRSDSRYRAHQS